MTPWAAPALLVAGVVALYAPSLGNGFVYDDHEVIVDQPRPAGVADLGRVFTEPHFRGLPYYRPVTRATLLAQKGLHGDQPWAFRLVNAALLGGAAVLAFALLGALGVARAPALGAAALFALHPVASSCVLPIASGRETLLPGLLILATLVAWVRGRRGAATVAFALALFAREQAIVVPLLCALADGCRVSADPPQPRAGPWVRRQAPLLLVAVFYLVVRQRVLGSFDYELAVLADPLAPLLSLAYGLQVAVAPFSALVYEPELRVWLSPLRLAAALLAGAGLALAARRLGSPSLGVALFWLGWFVATQLPTANLLRQEALFAERYAFLAILAPLALAAAALSAGWGEARLRRGALAAAVALGVVGAGVSMGRAPWFDGDRVFAEQWLRTNPRSPDAHHLLALTLAREGRLEQALPHYDAALAGSLRPVDLRVNRGAALLALGRGGEAERDFHAALGLDPEHPEAHSNLGVLRARQGRLEDAIGHYRAALRVAPGSAEAHNNLGSALARLGRLSEAVAHFEEALRLRPGYADALRNLELARARSDPTR